MPRLTTQLFAWDTMLRVAACVFTLLILVYCLSGVSTGYEDLTRSYFPSWRGTIAGESANGAQMKQSPNITQTATIQLSASEFGTPSPSSAETSALSPVGTSPSISASATNSAAAVLPDKIIVMGKLQREETDWVAEFFPDWQNAIYTVDNTSHALHTSVNKGHEANAYLLYILQNYDALPSTIAFLHPHRDGYAGGWHIDAADRDNVLSLKNLNLEFVRRNGYANLRCIWNPGCPDEVQPFREPPEEAGGGPSVDQAMKDVWPIFFGDDALVPDAVGTQCCAQFAVSRDQVRKRTLSEYQVYHDWLMSTEISDAISGRVFEYLWHIIFGQDPVYCPEPIQCYSDVYGIN